MKKLVVLLLLCNVCRGTLVYDDLKPNATDIRDLGSSTLRWNDVFFGNVLITKGDLPINDIREMLKIQRHGDGDAAAEGGIGLSQTFYLENFNVEIQQAGAFIWDFPSITSGNDAGRFTLRVKSSEGDNKDLMRTDIDGLFMKFLDSSTFNYLNFRPRVTGGSDLNLFVDMDGQSHELDFTGSGAGATVFVEKEAKISQDYTEDSSTVTLAGLTLTGDANLSDNAITDVNYIDFVIDINNPPHSEGRIFYDDDAKTFSIYNNESEVSLQIGQEMYLPRPTNKTGSTITNGQLVYINGAQGSSATIALAKADDPATCQVLAMATHDIEDNTKGYVTTFGLVHDVNTDGISAGDAVFLSATTAGTFTDTSPTAPDFVIQVGRCIFENSTSGIIYIQIGPTAVCGTMVIQDLDINVDLDVAGDITADAITGTSLTLNLTNDYLLTERGAGLALAIQNLAPSVTSRLELFTNAGDGTDALEFSIYAMGTPSDITDRELISLEYVILPDGGPLFEIHTSASGTGTILPYRMYTGANTTQLVLNVDNSISMSGDLDVTGAIVGNSLETAQFVLHTGDADTFLSFQADQLDLVVGNLTMFTAIERIIGSDEVVFNENGIDMDTRTEGVGQTHALFVQGSDGTVGIRTSSPDTTFQVVGTAGFGDDAGNEMLISGTGDSHYVGTAGMPFGDIHGFDENDTIAIGGIGIANKAQITSFDTDTAENNTDADHTNDHIQITIAGFYYCSVSIHMESAGGGAADEFGFGVYKNNGDTLFENLHGHRKLAGGGGDVGAVTLSGIVDLAVNDTIEVWCWNEDSADDVVIDDITLSLFQIGGT